MSYIWAAAGFRETLARQKMKLDVVYRNKTKVRQEFKFDAVKPVTEQNVTVAQAARDLDVHEMQLVAWVRELTAKTP